MQAHAIVRVFCVDGPCHGLHYLDVDSGRILFSGGQITVTGVALSGSKRHRK
jgi:hypothetical protein